MTAAETEIPAWEDPRRVLQRHGLHAKRSFSQNFLVSESVVVRIARALGAGPGDLVVELGGGLGTLTGALLRTGARVVAVDRDRDMLAVLRAELGRVPTLQIDEGDAAEVDLARYGERVLVAGNLPYAITGQILRRLVEQRDRIPRAVVMVQREVRDRMIAGPDTEAYGALSVFLAAQFECKPVMLVPPGAFHPPPRVTSAVVSLVPHAVPRAVETDAFRLVVRAAFEQRRKTLRNALAAPLGVPSAEAALEAAGIDGRRRGETLSVEELDRIAQRLSDAAV